MQKNPSYLRCFEAITTVDSIYMLRCQAGTILLAHQVTYCSIYNTIQKNSVPLLSIEIKHYLELGL